MYAKTPPQKISCLQLRWGDTTMENAMENDYFYARVLVTELDPVNQCTKHPNALKRLIASLLRCLRFNPKPKWPFKATTWRPKRSFQGAKHFQFISTKCWYIFLTENSWLNKVSLGTSSFLFSRDFLQLWCSYPFFLFKLTIFHPNENIFLMNTCQSRPQMTGTRMTAGIFLCFFYIDICSLAIKRMLIKM